MPLFRSRLVPPPVPARTFDWVPHHDPRSREYPIRTLLQRSGRTPRSYTWPVPAQPSGGGGSQLGALVLDQGIEGACVGFAWAHELAAVPRPVPNVSARTARLIYLGAQHMDEWPGQAYEGTSVLAGAKYVHAIGRAASYRWAFGLQDVVDTVGSYGPVVLGTPWYQGMMTPDGEARIHATGQVVGGHAVLVRGVNLRDEHVTIHNSWGPTWGDAGTARLSFDDLAHLLAQMAEACVPTRI